MSENVVTRTDEIKARIKELDDERKALAQELWDCEKQDSGYYIGCYEFRDSDYATLASGYEWLGYITQCKAKKWADDLRQDAYDTVVYHKLGTDGDDPNVEIGYSLSKGWDLLDSIIENGSCSGLSVDTRELADALMESLEADITRLHRQLNLEAYGARIPKVM